MKHLVSILIPAYNAEAWIADTIKSALNQTWSRKEIVIVDDGSVDDTFSIAQEFASNCVSVVRQENQGAAAARNKAFSVCRGDYIQWLDADDLLAPDKISLQMRALCDCADKRTLLSSAWGRFIYRPSKARFVPTELWCDLPPVEWMLRYFEQRLWMQTSSWLVSRELTKAAGPWDTRLLGDDDGEYFCRVVLADTGVRFVPEARVFYRRTANSLSYLGGSPRKLEAQLLSMEMQFRRLLGVQDNARTRAACVGYIQNFLVYFYPDQTELVKRATALASSLGGNLQVPTLTWKYAWLQKLLGWNAAKKAQLHYNRVKSAAVMNFDWVMSKIGSAR